MGDETKSGTGPLWSGRIAGGLAPSMAALNQSLSFDRRLWEHDLRGSAAWARALGRAGVITDSEVEDLLAGLEEVARRIESDGIPDDTEDEDIHSLVERWLHEVIGDGAGKLHTGRSRNDQVATDFRLWGIKSIDDLGEVLAYLLEVLVDWAEASVEIIMPGYTHLQQGQPVRAAHWVLSHAWPLSRDLDRLKRVARSTSVLPLGSGAIAGCPFPIDREFLRQELGFERISENSMDAVSDRDWAAELAFAAAMIGVHLSRLAEDLVLYSSREFGFVRLSDGFSTGSSLMPQKRNPDVAELTRGKTARLMGTVTHYLALLKGTPSGYNRDLQEDKEALFDSVDTLLLVLPAIAGAIAEAELVPDRISNALDPVLLATDLADYLVAQGVPFRRAHDIVAGLVRHADDHGLRLDAVPENVLHDGHPALDATVWKHLSWDQSVDRRSTTGGTGRTSVQEQIESIRRGLTNAGRTTASGQGES